MEELFNDLDFLEKLFTKGIINLEDYFKIKSSLVDYHKNNLNKSNDDDLPF